MVDYKNAERIRSLFSQLSASEYHHAYNALTEQYQQEELLRKQQGFDIALEPNTSWNRVTQQLLEYVRIGQVHPSCFRDCEVHPLDPLYPRGFSENGDPWFAYYDTWCQIMVRAIVVERGTYDIGDLMCLKDLSLLSLAGRLVSFNGSLKGNVAFPDEYADKPLSSTTLVVKAAGQRWETRFDLKTHYIYSVTAAGSLSDGRGQGVLVMREIGNVQNRARGRTVHFSCTPLIIGCGGGGPLQIPDATCVN